MDLFSKWNEHGNNFPPTQKNKQYQQKKQRPHFSVASTDRLARRSVTSIPSGVLLFPFGLDAGWPGSMVGSGWKVDPFKRWTFFRLCSAAVFFIVLLNTYRRGGLGLFFFLGGGGGSFFFDLPKIFPEKMFVQQSYSQTATLKMLFWIKSCCFSFHPLTSPEIEDRYPKWRHVWSRRYIFQGRPFYLEIYSWHVPGVHSLFFSSQLVVKCQNGDVFSHVIFFVHVWSMPYLYHIARAHILKFVKICIYIYIQNYIHIFSHTCKKYLHKDVWELNGTLLTQKLQQE